MPRIAGPAGHTRKAFLISSVLAAGAAAAGPLVTRAFAAPQTTDIGILDFALTLEQLEAAFYAAAAGGSLLTGEARTFAKEFSAIEDGHAEALSAALENLGAEPAEAPEFDWGSAMQSQASFVKRAAQLEDTVVSALNGAGPMIQDKELLTVVGSIAQVDARQAALLRPLAGQPPTVAAFDQTLTQPQALDAIAPYVQE
jgi:hypothetical protein